MNQRVKSQDVVGAAYTSLCVSAPSPLPTLMHVQRQRHSGKSEGNCGRQWRQHGVSMEIQAAQAKTLLHSIFIVLTVACPTSRCQGLGHMTTHKVTVFFYNQWASHHPEINKPFVQMHRSSCPSAVKEMSKYNNKNNSKKRDVFYSTPPHGQTWMKDKKIILITN